MAMSMGTASEDDNLVSTINTTPLVDVMLVLLIVFLITIPVVNFSVPVELPKERNEQRDAKPQDIVISIDSHGNTYWQDTRVATSAALQERLKTAARQTPQPEVQIRGDLSSAYAPVGRIVYACQRAGIVKVGFITEPPARS